MSERARPFYLRERAIQATYLERHHGDHAGHRGYAHILEPEHARLNIGPAWRADAEAVFAAEPPLQWHKDANNALSSQGCCVNFLLPLAEEPALLARWVSATLGIGPVSMNVIEPGRAGRDRYVAFEWISEADYLHEAGQSGKRTRGANSTAPDASLAFTDASGLRRLLLIEWKYTERYGTAPDSAREPERVRRYADIAFAPDGPIRADSGVALTDLFWEPIYQMLRQQMLAWQIEHDPASGFDRVAVLHLSPRDNLDLHRVTSPALRPLGSDVFEVFRSLLVDPSSFTGMSIEQAFAPLAFWPEAHWLPYLRERYPTLCKSSEETAS